MRELIIDENSHDQRLDRFIGKYLNEASNSFIFKMIRKKNIEVNKKRAKPETILKKGDKVQLFLSEDTINKFRKEVEINYTDFNIDVLYEDENIILINKPVGVLSHSDGENEDNIVDGLIKYLIDNKEYNPKEEDTFIPSICNRLDRNTSGIIIAAKNYQSLKQINDSIKNRHIKRYYKTIVNGNFKEELLDKKIVRKDKEENKMYLVEDIKDDSKEIETYFKALKNKNNYTLLEVELITGRTHQIRIHLNALGYSVIGDRKYGDIKENEYFKLKYNLNNQLLHSYKVIFNGFTNELSYLNNREFISNMAGIFKNIEKDLFN